MRSRMFAANAFALFGIYDAARGGLRDSHEVSLDPL